jgi:hypothetical protein
LSTILIGFESHTNSVGNNGKYFFIEFPHIFGRMVQHRWPVGSAFFSFSVASSRWREMNVILLNRAQPAW